MHTAIVNNWGESPKYTEVATPESRAAGTHYSATTFPHIPGVDGVGRTPSGQLVYFSTLTPGTSGFCSEAIDVPKSDTKLLQGGLDPVQAAGLLNPAMSSWIGLKKRTQGLKEGWTCLILGATTTSGRIAVSIVRELGAGKVVGVARNLKALSALGLDGSIQLMDPVDQTDFKSVGNVDVVLDYLYGAPALELLTQLHSKVPTQHVQIGSMAGLEANIPAAIFRSKDITMRGNGPGAWPTTALRERVE